MLDVCDRRGDRSTVTVMLVLVLSLVVCESWIV